MKEIKENPSMTYEEVLQDSSLAHFHEAIHLLQDRSHNDIFPQHYESSMLDVAETHVVKLWRKKPEMSLKMVVTKVMSHFPDDISADLISKITHVIIEKWTQLSALNQVRENVEVCV
jgi:hypothetical protein